MPNALLLTTAQIDNKTLDIIKEAKLLKENNPFFIETASLQENIEINKAFTIAYGWREMTKTFLFSSLKALGTFAASLGTQLNPDNQQLTVLQSAFTIISDDLGNAHQLFGKVAPRGASGIHYKWWENDILLPLKEKVENKSPALPAGITSLLNEMWKMAESPLGIAVQLRVVEAIAQDICIAFLAVFSRVEYQGQKLFSEKQLRWITTHIEAETVHNQQVACESSGMAKIALMAAEQSTLLIYIQQYAQAWYAALNEFAAILK